MMVWQLAQRIWHLRISDLMTFRELPWYIMSETFLRLSSRWSNWSTRWSVVPQSLHLPKMRLNRSTNALLRVRWYLFWITRVVGFSLYHLAERWAEQLLQADWSPSDLRLFFENTSSGRVRPQAEQRFIRANVAVVDRIVVHEKER